MIVYGWKAKNIKQAPIENLECPNCQQKQSVIAIFAHYAHIFWIPMFPYKKSAEIVCTHCQLQREEKALAPEQQSLVKQLKSTVPLPKYMFAGLMLILICVGVVAFNSFKQGNERNAFLNAPEVGDIYVLKDPDETSEYKNYLMKVQEVYEDSLYVSFNTFQYNHIPSKLEPKDGFTTDLYSIAKDQLQTYEDDGNLKKIIRNYSKSSGFGKVIYSGEVPMQKDSL